MPPAALAQVLSQLKVERSEDVIVGFENAEDAAVYRLNDQEALLQTVDVITPLVDDPFTFGRIAAANSLSDVYAMGGWPLTALSFVGYPKDGDLALLGQILAGGVETLQSAGCFLIGGHSVADSQIKIGFAVTGRVTLAQLKRNSTTRPGDLLVLTKPLGTGIVATAIKRQAASEGVVENAIRWMTQLNRDAAELMVEHSASAATDVTGFSLLGHALEMARASRLTFRFQVAAIPMLEGIRALAKKHAPGGTQSNRDYVGRELELLTSVDVETSNILFDPQTSGGLLVALSERNAASFVRAMVSRGRMAAVIGSALTPGAHALQLC
ncbi:MAG: selenide, water dikinase SelD [Acidobacteria bacterium]|nr:selenide, water dikinase SelD [Acidobacteriota bacterium]